MSAECWDVLVVGSGLLGAIVARRLAESGARVAVVERGRAVTEPPGSHLRNDTNARADPDGFFPLGGRHLDFHDQTAADPGLPGAYSTSVVGGSGILWTNNCPRAVDGVDRPDELSSGEWDRCYACAEDYLDVRADLFDDSYRGRAVSDRLGGSSIGRHRRVVPLPLSGQRLGPDRIHYVAPADVLAGGPPIGWIEGSVDRLEREGVRCSGVIVNGARHPAADVVLAAGAIETPAILWRSGIHLPALGSFLSFHQVLIGQVVLDDELWEPGDVVDPLPRLCIPPTAEHPWLTMLLRDTNPLVPRAPDLDVPANRLIEVQAFSAVGPDAGNRVTFDEHRDVRLEVPMRDRDRVQLGEVEHDVAGLCAQLGRFRAGCEPTWLAPGSAHLIGSCRMGLDPSTSVTDTCGRVHSVENLSLATNGVIPSRLAVNPTLTGAALAVRTADEILAA